MSDTNKKDAPAATQDALKSAKSPRPGAIYSLDRIAARVNVLLAAIIGGGISAALWLPAAYAQRGCPGLGGEVFLVAFGAYLGGRIMEEVQDHE